MVGTVQIISYRIVQETVCCDFHLFASKGRDSFIIFFHVIQALKKTKVIVYKQFSHVFSLRQVMNMTTLDFTPALAGWGHKSWRYSGPFQNISVKTIQLFSKNAVIKLYWNMYGFFKSLDLIRIGEDTLME